jgi:hypothetical protein
MWFTYRFITWGGVKHDFVAVFFFIKIETDFSSHKNLREVICPWIKGQTLGVWMGEASRGLCRFSVSRFARSFPRSSGISASTIQWRQRRNPKFRASASPVFPPGFVGVGVCSPSAGSNVFVLRGFSTPLFLGRSNYFATY